MNECQAAALLHIYYITADLLKPFVRHCYNYLMSSVRQLWIKTNALRMNILAKLRDDQFSNIDAGFFISQFQDMTSFYEFMYEQIVKDVMKHCCRCF